MDGHDHDRDLRPLCRAPDRDSPGGSSGPTRRCSTWPSSENPRFSFGVVAISVAFFSLFGAIFGVTQYLQLAHGYSALQAGAGMIPLALGLMVGAGSSTKLVPRFGTNNVVFAGLGR